MSTLRDAGTLRDAMDIRLDFLHMLSNQYDDMTIRDFPMPRDLFDRKDAPAAASLFEALHTFRDVAGYDLTFLPPGEALARAKREVEDAAETHRDANPFKKAEIVDLGLCSGRSYGALRLARDPKRPPKLDWKDAVALAKGLAELIEENALWRGELARREGQLGAKEARLCPEEAAQDSIAARLREVLRTGAGALGAFDAAGIYLLDEKTHELKTRAVWGLPEDRYLAPARPLRGARGELEALMGSAVAVNDDYLAEEWRVPETFPCAFCAPLVSEESVLGVVWFFANKRRELAEREMETLRLVSDRIVDELQREARALSSLPSREDADVEVIERDLREWARAILKPKTR